MASNIIIGRSTQSFRLVTVTCNYSYPSAARSGYSSTSPGFLVSGDSLPDGSPILEVINEIPKANMEYLARMMQDDSLRGWCVHSISVEKFTVNAATWDVLLAKYTHVVVDLAHIVREGSGGFQDRGGEALFPVSQ